MKGTTILTSSYFNLSMLTAAAVIVPIALIYTVGISDFFSLAFLPVLALCTYIPMHCLLFYFKKFALSDKHFIISYPFNKWKKDIIFPLKDIISVYYGTGMRGTQWIAISYAVEPGQKVKKDTFPIDLSEASTRQLFQYFQTNEIQVRGNIEAT